MTAEPATRSTAGRLVLHAAAGLALGYILLPLVLTVASNALVQRRYRR